MQESSINARITNEVIQQKKNAKIQTQWKKIKQFRFLYLLLLPLVIYFVVFSYIPLILGISQSFQESKLLGASEWVGFVNYQQVLTDPNFLITLRNGLMIGLGTLVVTFLGGLLLALGLNEMQNKQAKTLVQTTSYLPYLFSWSVVGGMWVYILSANGVVNSLLTNWGMKSILFLSEADIAQGLMILTGAWKVLGYTAVLFLASIVAINPSLF